MKFDLSQAELPDDFVEAVATKIFNLSLADDRDDVKYQELEANLDTIKQAIEFIYGYSDEGFIAFRSFAERGRDECKPVLEWVPNDLEAYKRIAVLAQEAVDNRRSAYIIPALMPNNAAKASDALAQCVIVCDIDSGDINKKLEFLTNVIGFPSMVVQSGGIADGQNKLHCYWKLDEEAVGSDLQRVARIQHRIAIQAGTDTAFQSLHQPLRLAGSWHCKGEPRLVSIVSINDREYSLDDIENSVLDMPSIDGKENVFSLERASDVKAPINDTFVNEVRANGETGVTRFEGISRIIGYWMSRVWEGRVSLEIAWNEVQGYNEALVRPPWPVQRLRDEFNAIYRKRNTEHGAPRVYVAEKAEALLEGFNFADLYDNDEPVPPDIIENMLDEEGQLLIAGAPKSQKSLILQWMLERCALGKPIWGKAVCKPLKVAYIQAEMTKKQLLKRFKLRQWNDEEKRVLSENFWVSSRFLFPLDKHGLDLVIRTIRTRFGEAGPDIIALDPIVNLLPEDCPENDNGKIMAWLRDSVERMRQECNPHASLILVHHSAKKKYEELLEDPFSVIRGASSLRGWYSQGMVIARKDHTKRERVVFFENRSCEELPMKHVSLNLDTFEIDEIEDESYKAENVNYGIMSIEQALIDASAEGKYYTKTSFSEEFAESFCRSASSLGREVADRLKKGTLKGYDGKSKGLESRRNAMYLWCEGLVDRVEERLDDNGEREVKKYYLDYTHWMDTKGVWHLKEENQ